MQTARSEDYYIPGGDLVLQVDGCLFRLHRYILGTYSGFFQDMFSMPPANDNEGKSDDKPVPLPQSLCSAQSFTTLCKFMYPRKFGVFPEILVKDLETWVAVIKATQSLQMSDIQDHILSRLELDEPAASLEVIRLLSLSIDVSRKSLRFKCFCTLAYRCRPISPVEGITLGGRATAQVAFIREQIRTILLSSKQSAQLKHNILLHNSCTSRDRCRGVILDLVVARVATNLEVNASQDESDIFRIVEPAPKAKKRNSGSDNGWDSDGPYVNMRGLCGNCFPIANELAGSLKKAKLDDEVGKAVDALDALDSASIRGERSGIA